MNFLLPTGIGDSVWALHKIKSIRDKLDPGGSIDVFLVGRRERDIENRALDFVRRFSFVDSVDMRLYSIHPEGPRCHPDGYYNYVEDGMYEFDGERYCVLVPNAPLERGIRLEQWLPHYEIDWGIFQHFRMSLEERAFGGRLRAKLGDYAVFYPGPLAGNTEEGHNRNALWSHLEWVELGKRIHSELGLRIVVVGAPYDASYYEWVLLPALDGHLDYWHNLIGATSIGQLFSVTSNAKFVISYQAGVGIVSTYLGTPTAIFWRPYGDSISPSGFLSFDERMASAWVPPKMIDDGRHLPLIYRRHGVDYIADQIVRRGWAAPIACTSRIGS